MALGLNTNKLSALNQLQDGGAGYILHNNILSNKCGTWKFMGSILDLT